MYIHRAVPFPDRSSNHHVFLRFCSCSSSSAWIPPIHVVIGVIFLPCLSSIEFFPCSRINQYNQNPAAPNPAAPNSAASNPVPAPSQQPLQFSSRIHPGGTTTIGKINPRYQSYEDQKEISNPIKPPPRYNQQYSQRRALQQEPSALYHLHPSLPAPPPLHFPTLVLTAHPTRHQPLNFWHHYHRTFSLA